MSANSHPLCTTWEAGYFMFGLYSVLAKRLCSWYSIWRKSLRGYGYFVLDSVMRGDVREFCKFGGVRLGLNCDSNVFGVTQVPYNVGELLTPACISSAGNRWI